MAEASHAVFLSYASEDAPAAQRIAEALRSVGIEVWFDREELRGGDAWDQKIRQQIRDCRLFVPIISLHTEARLEGYFRREWKLAVDRTDDMASEVAFLVPVVIDETPNASAHVPERFRHVQWTRLPGGETSAGFTDQVKRLLSPEPLRVWNPNRLVEGSSSPFPVPESRPFAPRRRAVLLAFAAVAVVALGYLVFERLVRSKSTVQGAVSNSIAVLPLANESGDASQQYFSDGLSEDLITALSQFAGLKVIGRTSSFQFRDSKDDSQTIGAKLGVAHLLEGSVRHAGDVVRVSAELIDTSDGSTQWSERYDRPYKDLFALQDDITRAVAAALKTRLLFGDGVAVQSDRPPSGSLDAYKALLQGKFYDARQTESDWRKAIEQFEMATQLDTGYALAWSWLSREWTNLGWLFLNGDASRDAYEKARVAADRALGLQPDLAAAHLAHGNILQIADFDWRGAQAEYRRALELAPQDSDAKFYLGSSLATFGHLDQAIELTRQALVTDPLNASQNFWLAWYLCAVNRLDEAERATRRAIELQPGGTAFQLTLTTIAVLRGDARTALAAAEKEPEGYLHNTAMALALQIGSNRAAADAALKTLIDKDANIAAYWVADVYLVRKDPDKAFQWLERAWRNRDPQIPYMLFDPFLLPYKDDPRFASFCHEVGLPVPGQGEVGHDQ